MAATARAAATNAASTESPGDAPEPGRAPESGNIGLAQRFDDDSRPPQRLQLLRVVGLVDLGPCRDRLASALRAMALQGFSLSPWLRIELRYLLALATAQAEGRRAYPHVAKIARKLGSETLLFPRLLSGQLGAWLRAVDGERKEAAVALAANALDLERDGSAWYGMGSALLAHALEGRDDGRAELIGSLHVRGVPAPEAFLTAYGPQWHATNRNP